MKESDYFTDDCNHGTVLNAAQRSTTSQKVAKNSKDYVNSASQADLGDMTGSSNVPYDMRNTKY